MFVTFTHNLLVLLRIRKKPEPEIDTAESPVELNSPSIECKRYSFVELTDGSSWKNLSSLNHSASQATEGKAIGGELV